MSDDIKNDPNVTVTAEAEAELKRVLSDEQYKGKAVRITIAGFG